MVKSKREVKYLLKKTLNSSQHITLSYLPWIENASFLHHSQPKHRSGSIRGSKEYLILTIKFSLMK